MITLKCEDVEPPTVSQQQQQQQQNEQRRRNIYRRCLYAFLFAFPVLTLLSFIFASVNYYLLFHILPNFITRLLFHCYMYARVLRHLKASDTLRMYFGIPLAMLL